jgi:hypothetical protein
VLRLYGQTALLALRRAWKAWPVAFSVILYTALMAAAGILARPLGVLGGFALGLAGAACLASYLHLLAQAVTGSKLRLADIKTGFAARFWDTVSVMFALWVVSLGTSVLVGGAGGNGPAVKAMVGIAMAFFLNALPELLYNGRVRSFALLLESARFVLANPVAWFLPNLVFAVILLGPTGALSVSQPAELLLVFGSIFSITGIAAAFTTVPLWAMPLVLLFLHYAMIFRGLLFVELTSGSSRLREFRARSS